MVALLPDTDTVECEAKRSAFSPGVSCGVQEAPPRFSSIAREPGHHKRKESERTLRKQEANVTKLFQSVGPKIQDLIQPPIKVLVHPLVRDVPGFLVELGRQPVVLLRVLGGLELQSRKVALLGFEFLNALLEGGDVFGPRCFGLRKKVMLR